TEPLGPDKAEIVQLVKQIDAKTKKLLGRALAIREVDAGSCNGCEIEITGLTGPVYDSERFGIHFVASPRHADMLLVTGSVSCNMEIPLLKTRSEEHTSELQSPCNLVCRLLLEKK